MAIIAPGSFCFREGCQRKVKSRGLCTAHYAQCHCRVQASEVTWAELEAQGLAQPDMGRKLYKGVCVKPTCQRLASKRGLCDCCYQMALKKVRAGRTTWAELEAQGLATAVPRKLPGKPREKPRQSYKLQEKKVQNFLQTIQPVGPAHLTWEDREFLIAVNCGDYSAHPEEQLYRAISHRWVEQECRRWYLSDEGARLMEEFNKNLFSQTYYPIDWPEE